MATALQAVYIFLVIQVCIVRARYYVKNVNDGSIERDQNSIFETCASEVNNARERNGRNSISYNGEVEAAAKRHNNHMIGNNCFSHQCSGEPGLGDRLSSTGYRWGGLGEIIAKGQSNCEDAVNSWLNSPGHKDIMLGNYQHFGCSTGERYWTCVFASPM